MFRDVVIPNDNEEEFAEVASRLGYKKLYFLYDFNEYNNVKKNLDKIYSIDFEIGLIVNHKNMNQALKESKILAVKSSQNDRFLMESRKIKLVYGFEEFPRKDHLHQRASGLNHILCEIARQNNVSVAFPYGSLLGENAQTVSIIKGRMMQNISLCRKYKVKCVIGSFSQNPYELRSPYDLASLFSILGMDSKDIKNALTSEL